MPDFQKQVNTQPAIGVAGDFASHNPRFSVLAGQGAFVAASGGAIVGRFAWATDPADDVGAPSLVSNVGFGPVTGFVGRALQGLITVFLQDASMGIPQGMPVTLFSGGDFLVQNDSASQSVIGQKAFADLTTGKVTFFAAAGTFPGGATDSGGAVVNTTLTLVGGVAGNVLTVASISAGAIYPGAVLNSNAAGSVVSQLSGTPNGVGTYLLSQNEQSVAAGTTIGGNYGVYTVGTATGTFKVGMYLTGGTTLPTSPPPSLTFLISGTGGSGSTFATNSGTAAQTSHALTGNTAIETKWIAMSVGNAGELVKISSQPLG